MIGSVRPSSTSAPSRARALLLVALAVLVASYLAQLASPLRLDTDSASYLQIAASIADGKGTRPPHVPAFPAGYPALVAGLDVVGLGTPSAIVGLNLAFLALGLAALFVVLRRGLGLGETPAGVVVALTLLSALVAKHAVIPLTEVVFFGIAAAAIAALTIAHQDRRRSFLAAGILLAVASCTVRTAGIALAPAVILAFESTRARVTAGLVAVVGGGVAVAAAPRYVDELSHGWDHGVVRSALDEAHDLLLMLGGAVGNVPQSKLHTVETPLVVLGAVALPLIGWALYTRRRRLGPVDGWVVGSLALLYVWPDDAARFMLPVLPFLLGYGALLARRWRPAGIAYATVFALLGVTAIVLSARLTCAGTQFPERYASGVLAPTYRVAWGMARPGDRARVEPAVLEVLRRFDPNPPRG
jgi:hypothetical protein